MENRSNDNLTDLEFVESQLGSPHVAMPVLVPLLILYGVIFVVGISGNVVTCLVILKVHYMRTPPNYYLLNLSVSDLMVLILMLPHDAYYYCYRYPYLLGPVGCVLKNFVSEVCTCSSVLTVTAFTVERYFAICHPLMASKWSSLGRSRRLIACVWAASVMLALPPVSHTGITFVERNDSSTHFIAKALPESSTCSAIESGLSTQLVFVVHAVLTFGLPLLVICMLYMLIGCAIRASWKVSRPRGHIQSSDPPPSTATASTRLLPPSNELNKPKKSNPLTPSTSQQNKKSILKVLVSIIIAFFICLAPLHAHRLFITLSTPQLWEHPFVWHLNDVLYFLSGLLFYTNSIVNPILYNLMSGRFRKAFRATVVALLYRRNSTNTSTWMGTCSAPSVPGGQSVPDTNPVTTVPGNGRPGNQRPSAPLPSTNPVTTVPGNARPGIHRPSAPLTNTSSQVSACVYLHRHPETATLVFVPNRKPSNEAPSPENVLLFHQIPMAWLQNPSPSEQRSSTVPFSFTLQLTSTPV